MKEGRPEFVSGTGWVFRLEMASDTMKDVMSEELKVTSSVVQRD
jgi:hypothetical protein